LVGVSNITIKKKIWNGLKKRARKKKAAPTETENLAGRSTFSPAGTSCEGSASPVGERLRPADIFRCQ
jgi:hypothetical protein